MGRTRVLVVTALLTLVAAACGAAGGGDGGGGEATAREPSGDRLFLGAPGVLTAMDGNTGETTFTAGGTVGGVMASGDWSTLYVAEPSATGTRLVALDRDTGVEEHAIDVAVPGLAVRAVSGNGGSVALAPPRLGGGDYPAGRTETTVVVSRAAGEPRRYDLTGNYEPEAFSVDGRNLFVIEYTPAEAPDRYRVRRLDLGSGEVVDVYSVDKELQEAMRGSARTQALSPDGTRLYTLYEVDELGSAFVHVLSLDERWAHCVDLPRPFGKTPEAATALTVSPDGDRLYVADTVAGALAEVDTQNLKVDRTTDLPPEPDVYAAAAAAGEDMVYVGRGQQVLVVDRDSLDLDGDWRVAGLRLGLQLGPQERRLYVARPDGVWVMAADTGRRLALLPAAGVQTIGVVGGGAPPPPVSPPDSYQCAC